MRPKKRSDEAQTSGWIRFVAALLFLAVGLAAETEQHASRAGINMILCGWWLSAAWRDLRLADFLRQKEAEMAQEDGTSA